MPNLDDLDVPGDDLSKNPGLEDALREGHYELRVVDRLQTIIEGLEAGNYDYIPDYIFNPFPLTLTSSKIDASDLTKGRIHIKTCNGGGKLTIEQGTDLEDVVIVTDCQVTLKKNVTMQDAILATSSTHKDSVKGTSGFRLGKDDSCSPGGGAQILTMGGVKFPAKLSVYGGQIIAAGDISFAAQADGIEGASMIAGGEIDGTSNTVMGLCGWGMEDNFEVPYFRLAG